MPPVGAGGKHRKVTDSAIQLTHRPSGIQVRVESERSQHQNRALARALHTGRQTSARAYLRGNVMVLWP